MYTSLSPAPVNDEGKEQISPRLKLSMIRRLKQLAAKNRRTISAEVEIALERHMAEEEEKSGDRE